MAGKAKMADLPEPSEKAGKPKMWWGGGFMKPCACSVNSVLWNKEVGYWYVTCNVDTTAAGIHRGWKWPGQSKWTWCSDYRRLKDSKIPPRQRHMLQDAAPASAASEPDSLSTGYTLDARPPFIICSGRAPPRRGIGGVNLRSFDLACRESPSNSSCMLASIFA